MRSQSLFNFFTKAADVTQKAGGPRVHTGADADDLMAQTSARAKSVTSAEQARRASMTPAQRHDEVLGGYLRDYGDPNYGGSVRHAYSNFTDHLRGEVAAKRMTDKEFYAARDHARSRLAEDQFNKMWDDYHAYTSPGLYGDTATAPSRMNSRMVHNGNQARYIFEANDEDKGWNPSNMTYAEFGKFFTGANGKIMKRKEALAKWNQAWRGRNTRSANGRNGVAGGTAVGAPQKPNTGVRTARPNDASRAYDMQYGPKQPAQAQQPQVPAATDPASTPANASNVTPTAPPSPITFKGGYTVGGVSGDIDWSAKGDGSINVGGAKLTADQYNAFNNVRSSLTTQLRQREGLSHTEAKARATQMANQWMADQVANSGKAQDRRKHVETPQPAAAQPVTPTPPVATPKLDIPDPVIPDTITRDLVPELDITEFSLPDIPDPDIPDPVAPKPEAANLFALDGNTPTNEQPGSAARPAAQVSAQSTTPAAPAPSYEQGFGHTSKEDFVKRYGENASYADLFTHYGNHAYSNMKNLKAKLTELKRQGKTPQDPEYKRLADQYKLSQSRYTSLYHAKSKMGQKGLNDIYQTEHEDNPLNWVFDEADDSSAYWKDHHASWGTSLQSLRDRETAMPEEFANFNLLW